MKVLDPNPLASNADWITYTVILEVAGGVCIFLAVYKLYGFIHILGLQFSIPQITLAIELLANLGTTSCRYLIGHRFNYLTLVERFIYNIDPAPIDRAIYTFPATTVMITFSYPYSLIGALLIAFYWQETIYSCTNGNSGAIYLFLQRMRIPFLIFSIVFILIERIPIIASK